MRRRRLTDHQDHHTVQGVEVVPSQIFASYTSPVSYAFHQLLIKKKKTPRFVKFSFFFISLQDNTTPEVGQCVCILDTNAKARSSSTDWCGRGSTPAYLQSVIESLRRRQHHSLNTTGRASSGRGGWLVMIVRQKSMTLVHNGPVRATKCKD